MENVSKGYRGVSLFLGLNIDRLVTAATVGMALLAAGWIQSI